MSGEQSELPVNAPRVSDRYVPIGLREARSVERAREMLSEYGIDPEAVGVPASELSEQEKGALHRYQYDRVYIYPRRAGGNRMEYEPIEFRTYIITVGPPSEELKAFIDRQLNARLRTLFNTGPYQGYMSGFNFIDSMTNIEDDSIAADEANNIGIPQFEVLVTKRGRQQGQATGFAMPFEVVETRVEPDDVPQEEVWNLSKQQDRYRAEPKPRSPSRERADSIRGKDVVVNGAKVGTMAAGGRVFIRDEYQNPDQVYRGQHSRKWLIDNTDATAAALRDGGNLYKIHETNDTLVFVTSRNKPDDFNPEDADAVDPDAIVAEEAVVETVEFAPETTFDIRTDSGVMLGKYDTPTRRDIAEETEFILHG